MLLSKISSEELSMIETYRHYYAFSSEASSQHGVFADNAFILREWDCAKSEYLEKLFGGELTITKRIKYVKSYEELEEEIGDMVSEYSHFGRAGRNGFQFQKSWNNYMYKNRYSFTDEQNDGLRRLMSDDCLISNVYDGRSFSIEDRNGKQFRINHGCKTAKALGKLADIFDLDGYEDYRICLSQILNQRELGGNLTISIHPLDYMTMSDNSYGWESCMSWEKEGGYRQGTVEMMNSRSVIVAYLAGDEKYSIGGWGGRQAYDWNSKKWRQLFVVDHNVIIGVKDYPYHNETLGKAVVEWLRELAEERLNWHYDEVETFGFNGQKISRDYLPEDKNDFTLEFPTDSMYCDFGCLDYHWMCLSKEIDPEEIKVHGGNGWRGSVWLTVPYSGKSECMVCGELNPDREDESCLACDECQNRMRCDCCGDIASETWHIDGMDLCEYCWENRVHECAGCGEEHYDENLSPVFVIPRISEEKRIEMKNYWNMSNGPWGCGFIEDNKELEECEYNFFKEDSPAAWICSDEKRCLNRFVEDYLKPGERPHLRHLRWSKEICVYLDQLNEDGLEELAWGADGDNEAYIETFHDCHINPTRFIELL